MLLLAPLLLVLLIRPKVVSPTLIGVPLNEATIAPLTSGSKLIFLIDGISLPEGNVTEFAAYINTVDVAPSTFRFQIYRPTAATNVYRLIGETVVTPSANIKGVYTYKLQAGGQVLTEQGDRLGLLNEDNHMCVQWKGDTGYYSVYISSYSTPPIINDGITIPRIPIPQAFGIAVNIEQRNDHIVAGITGPQGEKGSMGLQGPRGFKGDTGVSGSTGQKGEIGPQGFQGIQGLTGQNGQQGVAGQKGATGVVGSKGATGTQGDQGATGADGPLGDKGQKGSDGPRGATGGKGVTGGKGPTGAIGPLGPKGSDGLKGDPGPVGAKGVIGPVGVMGVQGPLGAKGFIGPIGMTGPTGNTGPAFVDVDECTGNHNCSHICENTLGSFRCLCREGFHLMNDSQTCSDDDECREVNGGCQQKCVNSPNTYRCDCDMGFVLGPDRHSCLDVDECNLKNGGCTERQNCINIHGGMHCIVKEGSYSSGSKSEATTQMDCEAGLGLLSRNTIIGFIIWLIILTLLDLVVLICLFVRRGANRMHERKFRDDVSCQQYSERGWDDRSQKLSSRYPDVNY